MVKLGLRWLSPVVSVTGGEEEESDEPPKVVVTEVKEEDAFYSKK